MVVAIAEPNAALVAERPQDAGRSEAGQAVV